VIDAVQQLSLLDILLDHWVEIRGLIGPSPAVDRRLEAIAARLRTAASAEELALVIDDLLELVMDTPAQDVVRELINRADLSVVLKGDLRTGVGLPASHVDRMILQCVHTTGQTLCDAMNVQRPDFEDVPVFFATNRAKTIASGSGDRFTGQPSRDVSYGQATVTIPAAVHRIGRLERPRWWTPFPSRDARKRFVELADVQSCALGALMEQLVFVTEQAPVRELLIFIHGYNVTFEEAARRAGQICYDLPFHGAVIVFSWPSVGRTLAYSADEERAAAAAEPLAAFLESLRDGPWHRVHLIAHSMGNRVMLSALADTPRTRPALGHLALVAADVYVEVFQPKFARLASGFGSVTSYASKNDRALWISSRLHRANRVGFIAEEPFEIDGMETIDATAVDTSLLGHSYFSSERSVLTDLGLLLREGLTAERRGLRRHPPKKYWIFPA
jgi:esterase/lipase superfamily enzyme